MCCGSEFTDENRKIGKTEEEIKKDLEDAKKKPKLKKYPVPRSELDNDKKIGSWSKYTR